jgi:hypothetical protein
MWSAITVYGYGGDPRREVCLLVGPLSVSRCTKISLYEWLTDYHLGCTPKWLGSLDFQTIKASVKIIYSAPAEKFTRDSRRGIGASSMSRNLFRYVIDQLC